MAADALQHVECTCIEVVQHIEVGYDKSMQVMDPALHDVCVGQIQVVWDVNSTVTVLMHVV